ncbi:MAG: glycosyltransferase family 1 protein [Bacteroidetes bacterium]|nr:glycosyltransferase family 1 protein [Bacteroidota bacterium]
MKFAILIEDYNLFYTRALEQNADLNAKPYNEKLNILLAKKYYQADSLAQALIKLGHQAEVIIPACNPLQLSWAKENNKRLFYKWHLQSPIRSLKARLFNKYNTFDKIRDEVLLAQIEKVKPDIVFVYASIWIEKRTIEKIKKTAKKIILQWTSPILYQWVHFPFNSFDFIVTASPSIVAYFINKGCNSFYLQQAFDTEVCDIKENKAPQKGVVFIGAFTKYHLYRHEVISFLIENGIDIDVYGFISEDVFPNSIIQTKIKPPISGNDMLNVYQKYKLSIHIYGGSTEVSDGIDWASFAGAKRIFEVTGVGTALLTSYQENLKDLFSEDEIITFKNKEECLEKIKYYLAKPNELETMAKKAQQKTLSQHTFVNRAQELLKLIDSHDTLH